MTLRVIQAGLAVVAACAAILSFSSLYELAVTCGFTDWRLAALLPVTIDVGAAVATTLWLAQTAPERARAFARALALLLLAGSVCGNAVSHGLAAYHLAPAWWVVVLVSAVAPSVLGAVVHLASLAWREDWGYTDRPVTTEPATVAELVAALPDIDDEPPLPEIVHKGLPVDPGTVAAAHALISAEPAVGRTRMMKVVQVNDGLAKKLLGELRPLAVAA